MASHRDLRFPSGAWRGMYTQWIGGRIESQPMRLTLKFWCDGRFDGTGEDAAGRFTVNCKKFSRHAPWVRFVKRYAGHKLVYQGFISSEERGMVGIWHDGRHCEQGTFALWPGRVMRAVGVEPTEDDVTPADLAAIPYNDDALTDSFSPAIVELAARCRRDGEATTTLRSLLARSGNELVSPKSIENLERDLSLVHLRGWGGDLSAATMDQPIHLKAIKYIERPPAASGDCLDGESGDGEAGGKKKGMR